MRVIVNRDVCQHHGQCVFSSPDVFRLDEDGELVYDAAPDDALRDDVEDAADVCPLQAITVQD
ncbi:ferredoxin [Streptomyces sp. NPDC048172]|uniref:ferredoxin n=1 Tax=Streptomyces sp. NPDC048172 TaxID=3365505 RepID=UPI00371E6124